MSDAINNDPAVWHRGQVRNQHNKGWAVLLDGNPVPIKGITYWADRGDLIKTLNKLGLRVDGHGWIHVK